MKVSCQQWDVANDSDEELACLKKSIIHVAKITGIDARFILAIMMQESKGCVRVYTTAGSHPNPGLLQSYNGNGTCNPNSGPLNVPGVPYVGPILTPCPASNIYQMILEGTNGTYYRGTLGGEGLKQDFDSQNLTGAMGYYRTARIYNGGRLDPSGDLEGPCCTLSYVSDIANRLMGWVNAKSTYPGTL